MTIAWSSTVTGISTNWRVGEWLKLSGVFDWFMHVFCQRAFGLLKIRFQRPFFVESALWLLTDCCLFDHHVIRNYTVHPAVTVAIISGETNDFVKQSWCQYFIKYEHLCINSPPKARMQWFVQKCSRMLVKIVSLVDWSYHVNAIH